MLPRHDIRKDEDPHGWRYTPQSHEVALNDVRDVTDEELDFRIREPDRPVRQSYAGIWVTRPIRRRCELAFR